MIDPQKPLWQVMIQAAQTPAFGIAVTAAVAFTGFAAATPSLAYNPARDPAHSVAPYSAQTLTPHPPHGLTPSGPATTRPASEWSIDRAPTLAKTQAENPNRLEPDPTPRNHNEVPKDDPVPQAPHSNSDLDNQWDEFNREAVDRYETWVSQHSVAPGPGCPPICTDATSPSPEPGIAPTPGLGGS